MIDQDELTQSLKHTKLFPRQKVQTENHPRPLQKKRKEKIFVSTRKVLIKKINHFSLLSPTGKLAKANDGNLLLHEILSP